MAELKPIAPYFVGQFVGVVDRAPERTIDIDACIVDGAWYGVSTEASQEKLARHEIAATGLVAYLPMERKHELHGRGGWRCVERPLLPGYLFVRCQSSEDHWHRIRSARGVQRLLGVDRPVPACDGEIEAVRLYEAEKFEEESARVTEWHRRAALARQCGGSGIVWHFEPGDRVRIKNGPFALFYAELEAAVDVHDQCQGGATDIRASVARRAVGLRYRGAS